MVKWHSVKSGDLLYDVHRQRGAMANWPVKIISVFHDADRAVVSWNGNRPQTWSRRQVEKLRRAPYEKREKKEAPG